MFTITNETARKFKTYTPVWEDDGEQFMAWLEIGAAWRDEHDDFHCQIDRMPINPEESFTGALRFVDASAPPPAPLTITREEFLESNYSCSPRLVVPVTHPTRGSPGQ